MIKASRKSYGLSNILGKSAYDLPTPSNLSGLWNFGSLLGVCLLMQVVTGMFLAIHYTSHVDNAFSACIHIVRDVSNGWFVRGLHANGASFFFALLYLHIGRGIYYGSYQLRKVWTVGVVMLVLSMAVAFAGYVLVWGQMSTWAATVITSLLSAIPSVGQDVVEWVWGGFAVNDATLHRFFVFHFIAPVFLLVLTIVHLIFLHQEGSRSPVGGLNSDAGRTTFHPFFSWKDAVGGAVLILLIVLVTLFFPNLFSEPENFTPANPMVTPEHIKPEWYFLWVYAILRSVPNKFGGVCALLIAILGLGLLPFGWGKGCYSCHVERWIFWTWVGVVGVLSWIGSCPAEASYNAAAAVFTVLYFLLFVEFIIGRHPKVDKKWKKLSGGKPLV